MDQDKERIFREILESYLKNVNTGKLIKGENVKSLEEKKELIRNIIRSLKNSPETYNPQDAFRNLSNYIDKNDDYQRFLYSEITIFLYSLSDEDKANIDSNLNCLVASLDDDSIKKAYDKDKLKKLEYVILKLYDHITLAKFQVQQIQAAVDESKRHVDDATKVKMKHLSDELQNIVKNEKTKALEELGRKISEESRNSQRGYVATLGIFSAIMLASFTSLAVAKDAVPLISGNLSRFLLVFCLVGSFIIILVQMLLNAIFAISDKYEEFKQSFLGHIGAYLVVLWIVFLVLFYVTA